MLKWHAKNKSMDGILNHLIDSLCLKKTDEKWLDFRLEPRNLRLTVDTVVGQRLLSHITFLLVYA